MASGDKGPPGPGEVPPGWKGEIVLQLRGCEAVRVKYRALAVLLNPGLSKTGMILHPCPGKGRPWTPAGWVRLARETAPLDLAVRAVIPGRSKGGNSRSGVLTGLAPVTCSVSSDPGPSAVGTVTPHLPGPQKTPLRLKLGLPPCTTDPRAGSCRGLILRRWRALLPVGSPAWQRPAGVWCPVAALGARDGLLPAGGRGPDWPTAHEASPWKRAVEAPPRGLAVYMEEASRPQVRPWASPLTGPWGHGAPVTCPASSLVCLQGGVESGYV